MWKYLLSLIAVVVLVSGCVAGPRVSAKGSTLRATMLGREAAEINLPNQYRYSGYTKITIGKNNDIRCRNHIFYCERNMSALVFMPALVEDDGATVNRPSSKDGFVYNSSVNSNYLSERTTYAYLQSAATEIDAELNAIGRIVFAKKVNNFIVIKYVEMLNSNSPFLSFPPHKNQLTDRQRDMLSGFESRANNILRCVVLK